MSKFKVFMVSDNGLFQAVVENGHRLGYVSSSPKPSRRLAWRSLVLRMANEITELVNEIAELRNENHAKDIRLGVLQRQRDEAIGKLAGTSAKLKELTDE